MIHLDQILWKFISGLIIPKPHNNETQGYWIKGFKLNIFGLANIGLGHEWSFTRIGTKFSAMLSNRKWTYVEVTPILRPVVIGGNRTDCFLFLLFLSYTYRVFLKRKINK